MSGTCIICGSNKVAKVLTLKHTWYCCNACGSASRGDLPGFEKRFAFRFSYKTLMKHKPPMATSIGRNKTIESDASLLYDYMASDAHIEKHQQHYKVFENFKTEIIERYTIDVDHKEILDISGGNGNFIKEFEKLGSRVSMTEFNQRSVDFAKEKFGIDARRFDFNKDDISKIFNDKKFDVVMLRFAVMFCTDLDRFLNDLNKILAPGAIVIVNGSTEPTLGTMLRWQYDDYTYLVLYDNEALKKKFSGQGFRSAGHHPIQQANSSYSRDMHAKVKRLDKWLYRLPAWFKWKNHDLNIRTGVFIFKKEQPQKN